MPMPEPVYLEVVERVPGAQTQDDADAWTKGFVRPNAVRLNGQPLAVPRGEQIAVERIEVDGEDLLKVTLTLFARRVILGAEPAP